MIGKSFKDSHEIPQLKEYDYREGSLVSAVNDPESITVDVYQKGNISVIVFFSIMEDTVSHKYQVMDVLEVKNVPVGWEVRTTFCRYQKVASVEIVALAKSAQATYLKEVRQAWRFSRSKRKFAVINASLVDCYQES